MKTALAAIEVVQSFAGSFAFLASALRSSLSLALRPRFLTPQFWNCSNCKTKRETTIDQGCTDHEPLVLLSNILGIRLHADLLLRIPIDVSNLLSTAKTKRKRRT